MTDNPGDRDVIDVTIPTAEGHLAEHRAYCRSVIAARAPEIGPGDVADAYGQGPCGPDGSRVGLQATTAVL